MATGPGVSQGKTPFVERFLSSNRAANLDSVNEAWKSAGNQGMVSESLVSKVRSRLKASGKEGANGGATEEAAAPAAKPKSSPKGSAKSSPKGAKGKAKPEAEATAPSHAEAREGGTGPAKSAFVEEVLRREPLANVRAINLAWSEAGHEGKISDSIFYKVKRELGGTGESEPGDTAAVGASQPEASEGISAPGGSEGTPQPSEVSETPAVTTMSGEAGAPAGVGGVVDEVEAGIDDLIFTLKSGGGMPEVEAALRAARRLLVRSQGE